MYENFYDLLLFCTGDYYKFNLVLAHCMNLVLFTVIGFTLINQLNSAD